ncbi:phage tail tube protein [bacterium]|nr:phage tail tube protein [bacterium]
MANTMNARDAISGALAECYVIIEGNRYNFMQIREFEAKVENNIIDVAILGRTSKGHKSAGSNGTWSGTAYFNQSILRELLYRYQVNGEMVYFDIQVTTSDPTSDAGRQTIILKNCLMDGGTLTKFNADEELLTEDISGTFDSWEMPEKFTNLNGMI